jgi:hypothetical protein
MLKTRQRLERRLALLDELPSLPGFNQAKDVACLAEIERHRCEFQLGDVVSARHALERATGLGRDLRQPRLDFLIAGAEVMELLSEGLLDQGAARLQAYTTAAAETTQGPEASTYAIAQLGCLLREQGKIENLAAVLEPMIERNGDRFLSWKVALAWAEVQIGQRDGAREIFCELSVDGFRTTYANVQWYHFAPLLGELCTWLDDRACAAQLYELILPCDGLALVMQEFLVNTGAVGRTLGLLAASLNRRDVAERHFQDALSMDRAMGSLPWVARSLRDYATMLNNLDPVGNRDRVTALAGEALAIANQVGMPRLPGEVGALLVQPAG